MMIAAFVMHSMALFDLHQIGGAQLVSPRSGGEAVWRAFGRPIVVDDGVPEGAIFPIDQRVFAELDNADREMAEAIEEGRRRVERAGKPVPVTVDAQLAILRRKALIARICNRAPVSVL